MTVQGAAGYKESDVNPGPYVNAANAMFDDQASAVFRNRKRDSAQIKWSKNKLSAEYSCLDRYNIQRRVNKRASCLRAK